MKKGRAWPIPRLSDNGDGTVTDALTGLVWLKDANCMLTSYSGIDADGTAGDGLVTWQHALDFVASMNAGTASDCAAGKSDWRLPSRLELLSLLDHSQAAPALPTGHPFSGVTAAVWSSTTYLPSPALAWFLGSTSGTTDYNFKSNPQGVWPVRGTAVKVARTGQESCWDATGGVRPCAGTGEDGEHLSGVSWTASRFEDNGDGTVTDTLTGLTWLADTNCIAARYPGLDTDAVAGDGLVTWQHALDFVASMNAGTAPDCAAGKSDWRLPNRVEAESLVNAGADQALSWMPAEGFLRVHGPWEFHWTSTTSAQLLGNAFTIFGYGQALALGKDSTYAYAWAVRGGP